MSEEETVFSSRVKFEGIFTFKDLYQFCHDWLVNETKIQDFEEEKYSEKLIGDTKSIDVKWTCQRKLTDYFKEKIKIVFDLDNITKVKIKKDGKEINANKGIMEMKVSGILVKDYQGKFEMTGTRKFLRSVYEKYVVPNSVLAFQEKVYKDSDDFLGQTKAFLDLEGKS